MKRFLAYVATGSLLVAGCTESNLFEENITQSDASLGERICVSMELLQAKFQTNPGLKERYESIERHTQSTDASRLNSLGQIEIPVVVNILYIEDRPFENPGLDRIQSQIDVLNEDFNATNLDVVNTPPLFAHLVADLDIQFVLVGVNRRQTTKVWWQIDMMKYSKKGGIDPTDPTEVLNIWIVPGIRDAREFPDGYAQFPGGDPRTDGVVVRPYRFGKVDLHSIGREVTHNVAHWMNIHDIWGLQVRTCGDDFVADTPQPNTCNLYCPAFPEYSTCPGTPIEMTMNFMDRTDDPCRFMFTEGQKARARAVFAPGGPRASFAVPD
jgi:Pregnancy-associated plasma protein-A